MGANEKFCLRWNDFETNISVAFRELREEKDFFDVTLACDDSQIQAHKVILSACSPFFRSILRRNPHQHPLLYLKGVKYQELLSVLNFMYMGEVNVAQEELNSFLAVAEDLRVKGLTQNNSGGGVSSDSSKYETLRQQAPVRAREPPERPDPGPPPAPKRPRTSLPPPAPHRPVPPNNYQEEVEDDDIQEVMPVKSEPREAAGGGMVVEQQQLQQQHQQPDPYQEQGGQSGALVLDSEEYHGEEGYDYSGYGEGGYDDGGGGYDPNTGLPIQDGNKAGDHHGTDLTGQIKDMIVVLRPTHEKYPVYQCSLCDHVSKKRISVFSHIQSCHTDFPGYNCEVCGTYSKTLNALQKHKLRCSKINT